LQLPLIDSVEDPRWHHTDDISYPIVFPAVIEGEGAPFFFQGLEHMLPRLQRWRAVGCPLYGMSQWARGVGFVKATSKAELTNAYVSEIRRIQPHGPYRLGGFSLGGLIAIEIAQQFRREGSEVEMLLLLDPAMPTRYQIERNCVIIQTAKPSPISRLSNKLAAIGRVRGLTDLVTKAMAQLIQLQLPLRQWWLYHLLDRYGRKPDAATSWLIPSSRHGRWPAFQHFAKKVTSICTIHPYEGRCLAVFQSSDERQITWAQLLSGPTQFHYLQTTHTGVFEEPVLSEWLNILSASLKSQGNWRRDPNA
jgi:thioesterase domain-containing protein